MFLAVCDDDDAAANVRRYGTGTDNAHASRGCFLITFPVFHWMFAFKV